MNATQQLIRERIASLSEDELRDPELWSLLQSRQGSAWANWNPRPDQPEKWDQQESFINSKTTGVKWLLGGNGAGTTETAMAATARFVTDTPPPRQDTPFWIIAGSYEQVCNACWKEKLHGHGHIHPDLIDWERVQWLKSKRNWPLFVPLKPWPDGSNWALSFKSYQQGREQMQAEAIGGFCFVEQFPYELLEEVLRGCREYSFGGAKICEYTPIDPSLSMEIEEMIDNGHASEHEHVEPDQLYLPETWEVYYANTECALEAGHVTQEWFDEFFGMVSPEMRATRTRGAFATFKGTIFTHFNRNVHLVGDEIAEYFDFRACEKYRAIDWGSGPSNPFCCLWGMDNSMGQSLIYDEYYNNDERTTIEHLMQVQNREFWDPNDDKYGMTYADPSDPDNFRIAAKLHEYVPESMAMPMSKAFNNVLPGIEVVQNALKPYHPVKREQPDGSVIEQPKLFILQSACPNLAREIRVYHWQNASTQGINLKDPKRAPVKFKDHSVDALRYALATRAQRLQESGSSLKKESPAAEMVRLDRSRKSRWRK